LEFTNKIEILSIHLQLPIRKNNFLPRLFYFSTPPM